jgi:transcriptional regulator with XRE-family HTH domain
VRRSEGYQTFLQVLIDQRISAGLTQAAVAEKLRKPQSFVSKYERGERRLDFVEAVQVSQALGLDPKQLFARFLKKGSEK